MANESHEESSMVDITGPDQLDPQTRMVGIKMLLDEAHGTLPPDSFADLSVAVRSALRDPSPLAHVLMEPRRDLSPASLIYLRPIEILLDSPSWGGRLLPSERIEALERYINELATRPIGATVLGAIA